MTDIFKVIVLSTAHVSAEVGQALDELVRMETRRFADDDWRYWLVTSPWSEYGWWVWVNMDDGVSDLPASLYDCLCFARDHGCRWVQFDCDGPIEEGLTTYDW